MKKGIKLLLEGIFDDFDDIYDDDTEHEEISNSITSHLKINSLAECQSVDDVNEYLTEKTSALDKVTEGLSAILNKTPLPDYVTETNWGYSTHYWTITITDHVLLRAEIADNTFEDLIYRNKPLHEQGLYVYNPKYRFNTETSVLWGIMIPSASMRNTIAATKINAIKNYNASIDDTRLQKINELIKEVFEDYYHTTRLADELTCSGKVYKVVQKDIDRMDKCIRTGAYAGFDAITKPDKMVARLAALFIVAKKQNNREMMLSFNDDTLMQVICGCSPYKTRRVATSRDNFIGVLKRLQKFPGIHLKDVIATYNAYKDKF